MKPWKKSTLPFKPKMSLVAFSIATALALTGCGGGGGDGNPPPSIGGGTPSSVSASVSGTATGVALNQPTTVTLTFTSKEGTSTGLKILTDLATLPTGWAATPAPYECPQVTEATDTCTPLTLTYTPTAAEPAKTLTIEYEYTDDEGVKQNGSIDIQYSAGVATVAYITQRGAADGAGSILKCSIAAADGALTCAPETDTTTQTLPAPDSIALNDAKSFAYVLNNGAAPNTTIYKCNVAADGTVSTCAQEMGATEIDNSIDLAVKGNFFYTLKWTQVMKCEYEPVAGTVGACIGNDTTGLVSAESFAFSGSRVWIADSSGTGTIQTCEVAEATGEISNCTAAYTFPAPTGEAQAAAPVSIALDGSGANAYIVARDDKSVNACKVDSTSGALSDCVATPLPAATGDAQAERIAVTGKFVYITSSSETAASNKVVKCAIGEEGAITEGSCAADTPTFTGEVTDIAL